MRKSRAFSVVLGIDCKEMVYAADPLYDADEKRIDAEQLAGTRRLYMVALGLLSITFQIGHFHYLPFLSPAPIDAVFAEVKAVSFQDSVYAGFADRDFAF